MKLKNIFIFLFLAIFPFGQIIKIGIVQPIDFIAGLAAVYTIIKRLEVPKAFKYLRLFVVFAIFTWIFSIFIFRQTDVLYGLLYLFRLISYYFFGIYIWNFIHPKAANIRLILNSLLVVSVFSAIFGWIQFFTVPDIKPFFKLGWDMHLFRLVGTFLDPTFLGLIIVFGVIISIYRFIDNRNWKNGLIAVFLLTSLAFTYSRGSFLALFAGLIVIAWYKKILIKVIISILLFSSLLLLLPTSRNHSIALFRTFSAISRIDNYKTTLEIFSKSPVFGVGYNNMCIAYRRYIGVQPFSSHACSGSDSSLLLILSTTGITGLIVFVFSAVRSIKSLQKNPNAIIFNSSLAALLVHSLFSNSMFYPWIMGYMVFLLAASVKERN